MCLRCTYLAVDMYCILSVGLIVCTCIFCSRALTSIPLYGIETGGMDRDGWYGIETGGMEKGQEIWNRARRYGKEPDGME